MQHFHCFLITQWKPVKQTVNRLLPFVGHAQTLQTKELLSDKCLYFFLVDCLVLFFPTSALRLPRHLKAFHDKLKLRVSLVEALRIWDEKGSLFFDSNLSTGLFVWMSSLFKSWCTTRAENCV
jgi:hypothetical protein